MKPFDLEAALRGEPVVTRDGREVTDLKRFSNAKGDYSLAGLANGQLLTWSSDGCYNTLSGTGNYGDLCMKPTTRKLTWFATDTAGMALTRDPALLAAGSKFLRILSAVVNEDGSVTVEVED